MSDTATKPKKVVQFNNWVVVIWVNEWLPALQLPAELRNKVPRPIIKKHAPSAASALVPPSPQPEPPSPPREAAQMRSLDEMRATRRRAFMAQVKAEELARQQPAATNSQGAATRAGPNPVQLMPASATPPAAANRRVVSASVQSSSAVPVQSSAAGPSVVAPSASRVQAPPLPPPPTPAASRKAPTPALPSAVASVAVASTPTTRPTPTKLVTPVVASGAAPSASRVQAPPLPPLPQSVARALPAPPKAASVPVASASSARATPTAAVPPAATSVAASSAPRVQAPPPRQSQRSLPPLPPRPANSSGSNDPSGRTAAASPRVQVSPAAAPAIAQVVAANVPASPISKAADNINRQNLNFDDIPQQKPANAGDANFSAAAARATAAVGERNGIPIEPAQPLQNASVLAPAQVATVVSAPERASPQTRAPASVAQVAAAQPIAPAAQPVVPAVRASDPARNEATSRVKDLRSLLDNAGKFQPYLGDGVSYDRLVRDIEGVANRLDGQVRDSDNNKVLTDKGRISAYQAVAADARAELARFDKQIKAAQGAVAAQRKAAYDAMTTDKERTALLRELDASSDGQKIIEDIIARLGQRPKADRDKKFVNVASLLRSIAAEEATLRRLREEKAYYAKGYTYQKVRVTPAKLQELKEFTEQELSSENIRFLEAIDAGADSEHLVQHFVAKNSEYHLNLSAAIHNDIMAAKGRLETAVRDNLLPNVRGPLERDLNRHLSEAADEIRNLVESDVMVRFSGKRRKEYDTRIAETRERLAELEARVKDA